MRRHAKTSASTATPRKSGRYGSRRGRYPSQAPGTPMLTSTSGPGQHAPASRAAKRHRVGYFRSQLQDQAMKIGELAERAGVHIETIRYYQRLGLMPSPPRGYGTVRRYDEQAIERLRFIKRAQALGFSLEEVKRLLELSAGEHCAETREVAAEKAKLVEQKITDLRAMENALRKLIRACDAGGRG